MNQQKMLRRTSKYKHHFIRSLKLGIKVILVASLALGQHYSRYAVNTEPPNGGNENETPRPFQCTATHFSNSTVMDYEGPFRRKVGNIFTHETLKTLATSSRGCYSTGGHVSLLSALQQRVRPLISLTS